MKFTNLPMYKGLFEIEAARKVNSESYKSVRSSGLEGVHFRDFAVYFFFDFGADFADFSDD
jgi:hypothetical protein